MATHRRGLRPAQWPVRDLLAEQRSRMGALRDPRLYAAVGGLLACGAAATVAFTASDGGHGRDGVPGPMALPAPNAVVPAPVDPAPSDPGIADPAPSRSGGGSAGGAGSGPVAQAWRLPADDSPATVTVPAGDDARSASVQEIADRVAAELVRLQARPSSDGTVEGLLVVPLSGRERHGAGEAGANRRDRHGGAEACGRTAPGAGDDRHRRPRAQRRPRQARPRQARPRQADGDKHDGDKHDRDRHDRDKHDRDKHDRAKHDRDMHDVTTPATTTTTTTTTTPRPATGAIVTTPATATRQRRTRPGSSTRARRGRPSNGPPWHSSPRRATAAGTSAAARSTRTRCSPRSTIWSGPRRPAGSHDAHVPPAHVRDRDG